jgi:hypothetical protein
MERLLLRKEWIVKCQNCGRDNHCDGKLIQDLDEMKNVVICDHCRCKVCENESR